jgi:hypothetical protein
MKHLTKRLNAVAHQLAATAWASFQRRSDSFSQKFTSSRGLAAALSVFSAGCLNAADLFVEPFADNSRGWTFDTEWSIGSATVSTSQTVLGPDPEVDHTETSDNGIAGYAIGGSTGTDLFSARYITSPVIDTNVTDDVYLEFWRWLNSDYIPFMASTIEVWDGSSWVVIYTAPNTDGGVQDSEWTLVSLDVTEYKNAGFRVRFGVSIEQSGVYDASSWNIDDLRVHTLGPVNSPPTDIALSGTSIAENQPSGTTVATISGTDPDEGQSATLSFSLVDGAGDADNGSFTVTGGNALATASSFNFEAQSSYTIRLRATDTGSPALTHDEVFTITVTDVNETTPVTYTLGGTPSGAITGSGAPDAAGTASSGQFDLLKRGGFLGDNGHVVFPGELIIGIGGVTASPNTFMGIWKDDGTGLKLLARSGDDAPEAAGAVFDILPTVPAINDSGEVTILASLALGAGTPTTTTANDAGLWSELGGTGLQILLREDDLIPTQVPPLPAGTKVGAFASGAFATARTGATTGEAAFAITFKGGSTDTAILRTSIVGTDTTAVSVVARQNTLAPGTTQNFASLNGSYTDSMRMDATGNLVFVALLTSPSREGIWYQPVGGAVTKAFIAGDTAPGTSGATFKNIKSPAIGSVGVITFRGQLNSNGDNATNAKNDGIWRGAVGAITPILRRGDSGYAGMPGGSKVGNVWHGWLNNANHGAWRAWLNVSGNGVASSTTNGDVNAIFTDINGGVMEMAVKVGDAAPGITGATFASMDLPIVGSDAGGGSEWVAFIGKVSGGGTTAGVNDLGIWRKTDAGAFLLVLRAGESIVTTEGTKTIQKIDIPGSGSTDRRWEQPVMDNTGRMILLVTFTDGSSSQVLTP